jgi:hypothetical protein
MQTRLSRPGANAVATLAPINFRTLLSARASLWRRTSCHRTQIGSGTLSGAHSVSRETSNNKNVYYTRRMFREPAGAGKWKKRGFLGASPAAALPVHLLGRLGCCVCVNYKYASYSCALHNQGGAGLRSPPAACSALPACPPARPPEWEMKVTVSASLAVPDANCPCAQAACGAAYK